LACHHVANDGAVLGAASLLPVGVFKSLYVCNSENYLILG